MALAHTVGAQAPGMTEPATAAFLEKRVPEELAADGVVLSRSQLGLHVEQVADKWLVSLVDLTTGRAAASTKIDLLPADREAAVAAMTHVVADLAAQIFGRAPAPPPLPETAPPVNPTVEQILREQHAAHEQQAVRERREAAEIPYRRATIRFAASYDPAAQATGAAPRTRWVAYKGEPKQQMDPRRFYREVGRPDLAEAYSRRKGMAIGSFVGAGLSFVAAYVSLFVALESSHEAQSKCFDLPFDQTTDCLDRQGGLDPTLPLVFVGVGAAGVVTGIYYAFHRHPIDEPEARALADDYNRRLRGMPGAPAAQRSLLHDVRWTPYVTGRAAGIGLAARF